MQIPTETLAPPPTPGEMSLLRGLFRSASDAVYLLDRRKRVVFWNPAAAHTFGIPEDAVLGVEDPVLGSSSEGRELLADALAGRASAAEGLIEVSGPAGRRELVVRVEAIGREGGFNGVLVVVADVARRGLEARIAHERLEAERTARAEAEAAARGARFLARTGALLDGSLDYLATLDNLARLIVPELADYCLIDELEDDVVSRVALAHTSPEREKLLHRDVRQPLSGDPDRHPVVRVMLTGQSVLREVVDDRVLEEISHGEAHLALLRKLGLHSFIIVPLGRPDRILGAITLAYAESGRRYTRADLEMAEEIARRATFAVEAARLYRQSTLAVQARERLLAVVSHDLRNSLATVLLNASAVADSQTGRSLPRPVQDQLQWIVRSAEQMNRLISDLLDASVIELGRLSLVPTTYPVSRLLADAGHMHRPLCEEKGIAFRVESEDGLPDLCVDAGRLLQVLANLLGNAIKFTPPGGAIAVTATREGTAAVRFVVEDTGPGIPAEHLSSIFDLYWQGRRERRTGAGLGLAIARAIVEAHGGTLTVTSKPGEGTTFRFSVPVEAGPAGRTQAAGFL